MAKAASTFFKRTYNHFVNETAELDDTIPSFAVCAFFSEEVFSDVR